MAKGEVRVTLFNGAGDRVAFVNSPTETAVAFFETDDLALGEGGQAYEDFYKYLDQILIGMTRRLDLTNFQLIIKWRDTLEEDFQESVPIVLDGLSGPIDLAELVDVARFYRFRFEHEAVNVPWFFYRIELRGALEGEFD